MHEDAPKMSVAQSLAASTSQEKSEIVTEVPVDYEINCVELKPTQTIEMELKLAYANPTSGKYPMLYCNYTCRYSSELHGSSRSNRD